jgi:hypothetical protein
MKWKEKKQMECEGFNCKIAEKENEIIWIFKGEEK